LAGRHNSQQTTQSRQASMVEATDKDTEAQVQRCRHHRVLDSKQALPTDRLPPSADRQTDSEKTGYLLLKYQS